MEKNGGDVRRVMSSQNKKKPRRRHHHQHQHNHLVFSGNKERVKRLSVVEKQMGIDDKDELHSTILTSMNFKLPKKIFTDSNTSVPRKLRSAIRKRSCESASVALPDAKRSNNSLKNSKICTQNGWSDNSTRGADSVAISKDEEEVAETLFALAGMIPRDGLHNNNKTGEEESLEAKTFNFKKHHSHAMPTSEDPMSLKEEPETTNPNPTRYGSPRDSLQAKALNDSTSLVWSKLPERRQMNPNMKVSVPPVQFQAPPLLRACSDRVFTHLSFFDGSTEQYQKSGLNETIQKKPQFHKRDSHINVGVADLAANQDREHTASTDCRENVLTSRPLHGSGVDGLPLQSSATVFPSWLRNTSSSKPVSCKDTPSTGKIPCSINGGRKSWRRCIAHVYISRLIQALQSSERKDTQPLDTSQLRPSQFWSAGHVVCNQDDPNATRATGHMFGSAAENICDTANDGPVFLNSCQVEEGRSLSGICDLKKQSFNFLSLSTGVGTEANNGANRLDITMESKGHVLQLHSVTQHNTYVPCSMPQNRFSSIRDRDQVAVVSAAPPSMPPQVHIQVPPYYSNQCGSIPLGTTRSTQQPHLKQQQHIWTAQLAAQFRPSPLLSSNIANWQNSTQDSHSITHLKAHLAAPQPSIETIGSKYLHISQQPQQQFIGLCPSLPTSNVKLQNSQLPSIREDKGGRFHSDGVLPLQLLCNERLLS